MTNNLRVLLVDDSPEDVEQAFEAFRKLAPHARTHAVSSLSQFDAEMEGGNWSVVLTEMRVGDTAADQLLGRIAEKHPLMPVIVLGREISDDDFRQVMVSGACDVVRKGDWVRLVCAIEREVRVADCRREAETAQAGLRSLEERFRATLGQTRDALAWCHDGIIVDASPAFLEMTGYESRDALRETPVLSLIEKSGQTRFKSHLRGRLGETESREFPLVRHDGGTITTEVDCSEVEYEGQKALQVRITDITHRKTLESRLESATERDALTGLVIRRTFMKELTDRFAQATDDKPVAAVIGIELKGLRRFNEEYGHGVCDDYIRTVSQALSAAVHAEWLLSRVGGGQFAVLAPITRHEEADAIEKQLTKVISGLSFDAGGKTVNVEFVANMRLITDASAKPDRFMRNVFPPLTAHRTPADAGAAPAPDKIAATIRTPAAEAEAASAAIKKALAENRLSLRFQPLIALHGECADFYEVLPGVPDTRGEWLTRQTITAAMQTKDAAVPIDRWIVSQAIDRLADQRRQGRKLDFMIGLSAHAPNDSLLLNALAQHLKSKSIKPKHLHVRVPAAALATDPGALREFTERAAEIGINVVFGGAHEEVISDPEFSTLHVTALEVSCANLGSGDEAGQRIKKIIAAGKAAGKFIIATDIDSPNAVGALWGDAVEYIQGDCLGAASSDLDQPAVEEQTLASDSVPGRGWRSAS
jgi:diguanylate cyclase (GGDEF)-like protein/PAS domain S-box-containing protein